MAKITIAYLQGILGDATYSKIHKTHRISQRNREWLERIKKLLGEIGDKSWIYKEGKNRNVYVLETTSKRLSIDFDPITLRSDDEKIAYIRGYFDAEGGVSRDVRAKFYDRFVRIIGSWHPRKQKIFSNRMKI